MGYGRYIGRNWGRWYRVVIVNWFRFMWNHPRFGAQISRRRYHRNAAGTVMSPVAAGGPVAASAAAVAVVRLLLCLAHVLGWNPSGHEAVVVVVLRFPATMLLVGQRNHVGWSWMRLVVSGGWWDSRMVMVAVVVDPWSLGWHIGRRYARQVRQMGRWWRWVAHVLWWSGMSVHHPGLDVCCCWWSITHESRAGGFIGEQPFCY